MPTPLKSKASKPTPAGVTAHSIPTRDIRPSTACILWGRAAGRCQFPGCNRPVHRSGVTAQQANIAEKAHIYAFRSGGPRGHKGVRKADLNSADNLLLVCHDCHVLIDRAGGATHYPAEFLIEKKLDHERRVEVVTGIDPSRKSHVLLYGANVGVHTSPVNFVDTAHAMFPSRYPAEGQPISLGMLNDLDEQDDAYWGAESDHLRKVFGTRVRDRVRAKEIQHLSVFGLAPQPLLVLLGTLLADITPADVYQRHREPPSWAWPQRAKPVPLIVEEPNQKVGQPALVLGLSATVTPDRVTQVLGPDASIWSIRVTDPHNDMLRSRQTLSALRRELRRLLDRIKAAHGESCELHVFPAAPAAASIELGRVRMPKADTAWVLYDQLAARGFVRAFTLPRGH